MSTASVHRVAALPSQGVLATSDEIATAARAALEEVADAMFSELSGRKLARLVAALYRAHGERA